MSTFLAVALAGQLRCLATVPVLILPRSYGSGSALAYL
jgi:hypothetical protein